MQLPSYLDISECLYLTCEMEFPAFGSYLVPATSCMATVHRVMPPRILQAILWPLCCSSTCSSSVDLRPKHLLTMLISPTLLKQLEPKLILISHLNHSWLAPWAHLVHPLVICMTARVNSFKCMYDHLSFLESAHSSSGFPLLLNWVRIHVCLARPCLMRSCPPSWVLLYYPLTIHLRSSGPGFLSVLCTVRTDRGCSVTLCWVSEWMNVQTNEKWVNGFSRSGILEGLRWEAILKDMSSSLPCGAFLAAGSLCGEKCSCFQYAVLCLDEASLLAQTVKNLPTIWKPGFDPWVGRIPWRRERQPTPVFLPEESHGQRSLAGYSPWGCKSRTWLSR